MIPAQTDTQLMLFAEGIRNRASRFQSQEVSEEQMMRDISGRRCLELYALVNRDGLLPKMLLAMFNSASMRSPHRWRLITSPSGRSLFQLHPLAHGTDETEFGLLPTPTVCGNYNHRGASKTSGDGLATVLRKALPTPLASDYRGGRAPESERNGHAKSSLRDVLTEQFGASGKSSAPHPSFVEAMMGYPIGHTALKHLETPSFRKSRSSSEKPSCNTKGKRHDYLPRSPIRSQQNESS